MTKFREEMPRSQATSRGRPGPAVSGHTIQSYEDQHTWVIDQMLIPCSAPEYRCLKLLLERVDRCVPFADLCGCLPEMSPASGADSKQERLRIAHLMSTLRAKMWACGLDIAGVMNVGYILLSGVQERSAPAQPLVSDDTSN